MVSQLARAGVPTVVVGDVPGVTGVADHTVSGLGKLIGGAAETQPLVVFVGQLPGEQVSVMHQLVNQRQPRIVPVVVGPGPRSRWSITVGEVAIPT